jgi:hypothetical protein
VPEWLKGTDCKSVGARLRWFKSNPLHHYPSIINILRWVPGASHNSTRNLMRHAGARQPLTLRGSFAICIGKKCNVLVAKNSPCNLPHADLTPPLILSGMPRQIGRSPPRGAACRAMRRTHLYVDGFNLYHAIDDLKEPQLKWRDLRSLAQGLLRTGETLGAVNHFSAYATWRPTSYTKHRTYTAALRATG